MTIFLAFFVLMQTSEMRELEPINATVFLDSGETREIIDFKIQGPDPYLFTFSMDGYTDFVSLHRVTRIKSTERHGHYIVTHESGEVMEGQIGWITFTGKDAAHPTQQVFISMRHVDRVHIISGSQLRSCDNCGYQDYTPYTYCPVCGAVLSFGEHQEDEPEEEEAPPPDHRQRLDPRDPTARHE